MPYPTPTEKSEHPAYEYARRFTMPIWNAVLQLFFDYLGPVFPTTTFMEQFNDPKNIVESPNCLDTLDLRRADAALPPPAAPRARSPWGLKKLFLGGFHRNEL